MVEQRAPERLPERARPERVLAEARPKAERDSEMPSRKGGYERMVAEALRPVEAATQSATTAAAEEIGASVTRLMQETTRGLRAAMMLPMAPGAGFGDMQEAFATMVAGMMRDQIRLAQEMLRIYGPQQHAALMQKVMRHWMDTAMASQAAMLRMAQPASDEPPGTAKPPRTATH
jgi:hypothetical protein